eukprot:gene10198-12068_t
MAADNADLLLPLIEASDSTEFQTPSGTSLRFSELSVYVIEGASKKALLHRLSGGVHADSKVAVLGGSGAGKSTLLNTLSGRSVLYRAEQTGCIYYDGCQYTPDELMSFTGYVTQDDVLLANLTVWETLFFAANLQLPASVSASSKMVRVNQTLSSLGLLKCRDTLCGTSFERGISGGERRRVSIAIQLLRSLRLLLLDEPTSGLDSVNAYQVVVNLYAVECTCLFSIHQPGSSIIALLGSVMIMALGELAYFGPTDRLLPFLARHGHESGSYVNPLDFALDLLTPDSRSAVKLQASLDRIFGFLEQAHTAQEAGHGVPVAACGLTTDTARSSQGRGPDLPPGAKNALQTDRLPFMAAVATLARRLMLNAIRDPLAVFNRCGALCTFGVLLLCFFPKLGHDQASIQDRQGVIFESIAAVPAIGVVGAVAVFPPLRKVLRRELLDQRYSTSAFLAAHMLVELPFYVIGAISFSGLVYPVLGLNAPASAHFWIYAFVITALYTFGEAVSTTALSFIESPTAASNLSNSFLVITQVYSSGLFRASSQLLPPLRWLSWGYILRYATELLQVNEYTTCWQASCPVELTCEPSAAICIQDGGELLEAQFPGAIGRFHVNMLVTGLYALGARMDARARWLAVLHAETQRETSEAPASSAGAALGVQLAFAGVRVEMRGDWSRPWEGRSQNKVLLEGASGIVEGNELCAILGGSGCGKTTLLNSLASRLEAKYVATGDIMLDGRQVASGELPLLLGYIPQDDDSSSTTGVLTVREFLWYIAMFHRLPAEERTSAVLWELGLAGSASTLVSRTSGGERRRVSIAAQMLKRPKVMLLDEPTTGLDASTANGLIAMLHRVCRQGCCALATVHQPRSDVFTLFDNVVILASGRQVYGGPTETLIPYLASAGHACPTNANPFDFIVDLVTVHHNGAGEAEEAKIQHLVDGFERSQVAKDVRRRLQEIAPAPQGGSAGHAGTRGRALREELFLIPLWRLRVLTSRLCLGFLREREELKTLVFQFIGVAGIMGLVFWNVVHDAEVIRDRERIGLCYMTSVLLPFNMMLSGISRLSQSRASIYREVTDGLYTWPVYHIATHLVYVPFLAVMSTCSALLMYGMGEQELNFKRDSAYMLVILLGTACGSAVASFASALQPDFQQTVVIANFFFTMFLLPCGFMVNVNHIPSWLSWTKDISFIHHSLALVSHVHFADSDSVLEEQLPQLVKRIWMTGD